MKEYYYKEIGYDDFNGPFTSIKKAKKAIEDEHKQIWESSCECLQKDSGDRWANPVQIFKLVKNVELKITANIKLVETK